MYDTETDPFDSHIGQELLRRLRALAQEHFPDTWEETSYITQTAGVMLANGWLTLEHGRTDHPALLGYILTQNGITRG